MIKDLTNQRFGKLLVIGLAEKDHRKECKWLCKCDCGNTSIVYGSHLRKGNTISCGCVMRNTHKTHGNSKTRLHQIWIHMRDRCNNPNSDNYKYYGERGIMICNEWNDFKAFYDWAMSNGYGSNLTIDRIDVNGNYEPSNCRWITQAEQMKNTRKCILLEHDGITDTLRGWAKRLGIPKSTLQARYQRGVNIF